MSEVVNSIKRVTDIMGEISAASHEQSQGVAQVGDAVAQLDQTTQQNAALVEQMAAAASSMKSQAQELVQTVAVFNLGNKAPAASLQAVTAPAVRSTQPPTKPHRGPERREGGIPRGAAARNQPASSANASTAPAKLAAPAKPAAGDDDWASF
jgi:methyl-accepting chemotaxis protein